MLPAPNPLDPNLRADLARNIRNAHDLAQLKTALLGVLDLLATDVGDNRTMIIRLDQRVTALHS
jgi:hypothetical protein